MKPTVDDCWYSGRHEFCKETYPGQYEWCSETYHRCVQCTDDNHCPSEKPYCDWDMECEECLVSAHCMTGESCLMRNGHWVCRRKDCVDYIEEGDYDYCANNFRNTPLCDTEQRRCVECIMPSDCEGARRTCIASICVDESEMDCAQQIEAGFLNYCSVTFPELPICHTRLKECVECQYNYDCPQTDGEGKSTHTCEGTRCIPKEWECEGPEDCMSNRYKCVLHECVLKDCSDYDDPDAFCAEKWTGWRCLDKTCVRCIDPEDCREDQKCANNRCVTRTCDEDTRPNTWCRERFGESYKCVGHECVEETQPSKKCSEFISTADADEYCASLDPAKPHCDFDTGRCHECNLPQHCPAFSRCWNHSCRDCLNDEDCDSAHPRGTFRCTREPDWKCVKKTCTDESNPDGYCRDKYGAGYKCEEDICVLESCGGIDTNCPEGYYCPERECIWGCRDERNCPDAKPHCSAEGSCVECFGPPHCGNGYSCIDYVCIKKEDCLHQDSLCPKNEYCDVDHCEKGCRDSKNCGDTAPHCSQNTGNCEECVTNPHCEEGYDCDNFKCVWVGYDCSYDPECPKNWYCSNHSCVFGCNNSDENCARKTPYCSQETGKCEECWSNIHCEGGNYQRCDEYRCVAREGNAECKEGDVKHGKRCREGIWVSIECKGPEDCKGHEYCDDGMCRDRERGCEIPTDCPVGYYCNFSLNKCEKQECRTHDECPLGRGCNIGTFGWHKERDNAQTECISWRDYYCSDNDPCPEGWTCDRGTGQCVEALCGEGKPCQDDRYKCVDNFCIPKSCNDWDDPQGHCMEEKGWYGRCVEDVCTVLPCDFYPDPDLMCQETEGGNWRCVGKRCMDLGAGGGGDPNRDCSEKLGIDEAYWDFEKRECAVPDCNAVSDPDKLCSQLKDLRYKCREGECRRGREGEECEIFEECMTGLRCASGVCMEKECIRWQDCESAELWCNHGVCEQLRAECEGPDDCRDDYHCDAGGQCVPNDCDDHYDCGEGECCDSNKKCERCENVTCWDEIHCRHGWRCNPKTNRCEIMECTLDVECDEGYYCDLSKGICRKIEGGQGCWDNTECPEGQICKGARGTKWVQDKWPFGTIERKVQGICVEKERRIVVIEGTDDEETCDYCRRIWSMTFEEGKMVVYPPYHKGCRCRERSED